MAPVAALLLGLAVWVALPRDVARRPPGRPAARYRVSHDTLSLGASLTLGVGVAFVVGGIAGGVLGSLMVPVSMVTIRWLSGRADRSVLAAMGGQAPAAADLLASALASGADPISALEAVAPAIGEPLSPRLLGVAARLRLGATPRSAWSELAGVPGVEPLAAAMVRSAESGAPLAESLRRAASDLRQAHRADLMARARVLGVRTVLPLGLCFLPAFLLLGVVPVVVSLVRQVLVL